MSTDIAINAQFYENGRTIDLISLALVAEDGEEFYGISLELPFAQAFRHPYLGQNVMPLLPVRRGKFNPWDHEHGDWPYVMPRAAIATEVRRFITRYEDPCLWADHAAYPHLVLAQLFGRMVDLPHGIPMWTADIQQELRRLGPVALPELPVAAMGHALASARHTMTLRRFLREFEEGKNDGR